MGKNFKVLEKSKPPSPHSVILEHRNKQETLLFESQAVANLCKNSRKQKNEKKKLSIFSNWTFFLFVIEIFYLLFSHFSCPRD